MFKTAIQAACIMAALVSPAAADDLWDGFYGGVQVGYLDARTFVEGNRFTYNQNQAVNIADHIYDGGGLSGFVGWNHQNGDLVLGGEFSLGRSDLDSNLVFNSDNDIDQVSIGTSGSLTGRIGYAGTKTLGYLRAGIAFAEVSNLGGDVNSGVLTESDAHRRDDIRIGATLGLGVERFVSEHWFARLELGYTEFQSYAEANDDGAPGSQVYSIDNGPIRSISIGIARKF